MLKRSFTVGKNSPKRIDMLAEVRGETRRPLKSFAHFPELCPRPQAGVRTALSPYIHPHPKVAVLQPAASSPASGSGERSVTSPPWLTMNGNNSQAESANSWHRFGQRLPLAGCPGAGRLPRARTFPDFLPLRCFPLSDRGLALIICVILSQWRGLPGLPPSSYTVRLDWAVWPRDSPDSGPPGSVWTMNRFEVAQCGTERGNRAPSKVMGEPPPSPGNVLSSCSSSGCWGSRQF